ncbi:MAG: hypothetical protein MUP36_01455 [Demequinaceae bacterium]|nr:hypothetical protein [Demequinaceae bacterium]
MKNRSAAVAAVAIGMAMGMASCSIGSGNGNEGTGVFTAEDIDGFSPMGGRFSYGDTISIFAEQAWLTSWPDAAMTVFEPAACLTYLTSSEMLLESDGSESSADALAFIEGMLTDGSVETEELGAVYVKARVFPSALEADGFVSGLETSVDPCVNGYTYSSNAIDWSVGSIGISQASLTGVGPVLVLDERNLTAADDSGMQTEQSFNHYTHYVYSQGNVVFIASYVFSTGSTSDDDAAELIGQFIEHLG